MAVGKNAGKATSGWKPQKKFQGSKSTNADQSKVPTRPKSITAVSNKKSKITY